MPVTRITPVVFIRVQILGMSNRELAEALKVSAAQVTRYEQTGRFPDHHRETITALAKERKAPMKKAWFDAVPWDPAAGVPA